MLALLLACPAGCGAVRGAAPDGMPGDATPGPHDAAAICDPLGAFGSPQTVLGLAISGLSELTPRLSSDELTMYLDGIMGTAPPTLYVARRGSRSDPFGMPDPVTAYFAAPGDGNASMSSDGLTLWLAIKPSGTEGYHLYVATRPSTLVEFGPAGKADAVNSAAALDSDAQPFVSADGEELWFASSRPPSTALDVWRAVRAGTGFGGVRQVVGLSSSSFDQYPSLSADRLTIYVSSGRTPTRGGVDIWRSHRTSAAEDFPAPAPVDELNSAGDDYATWLSADNCRLYGSSNGQIWVATRHP